MQTIHDGTNDILPAAALTKRRSDRDRMPVTIPVCPMEKLRRDGSSAANVRPEHPVEERGGVHGASELKGSSGSVSKRTAQYVIVATRRNDDGEKTSRNTTD